MLRRLLAYWPLGLIALVYLLTHSPHPGFGDSLGFLLFASQGFDLDTNATSHFLYNNLNHLVLRLFPGSDPVQVLWGVVGLFALLTTGRLYQHLRLFVSDGLAWTGVVMFALSFSWWRQAVTIEVYTLSAYLALSAWHALARDLLAGEAKRAPWVGVWLGLALLTHIQHVLLLPVVGLYGLRYLRREPRRVVAGAAWLLGLSSWLFILPLWLDTHPWWWVFAEPGAGEQVFALSLAGVAGGGLRSLFFLLYNFHLWLIPLAWGAWLIARKKHPFSGWWLGAWLPYWLFAMRYPVSDSYVFYLWPYLLLLWPLVRGLEKFSPPKRMLLPLAFLLSPLLYLTAWQAVEQVPALAARFADKSYKGGARYYLWPGQAGSADPLELARQIKEGQRPPLPDFERYPVAVEYLDMKASNGPPASP